MSAYPPIEDHGIIGDLYTVALVDRNATIDFLCFPDFDSPTVFASLLDHEKGGSFCLAPVLESVNRKQVYLPNSNILLTRFLSDGGVGEVSDYMPVESVAVAHNLVRRAKAVRGEVRFRMQFRPRFDYARAGHRVERDGDSLIFVAEHPSRLALRLRSRVPMQIQDGDAGAEFVLRAGESAAFVLELVVAGEDSPSTAEGFVPQSFKETLNFWRQWIRRSTYRGRWREMVDRSALVLKLLTSSRYGSIVAAPTFGLPEAIGGDRNWDYRYTWIRDASFTVYALFRLGFTEEATAFMDWIFRRCQESRRPGALHVMYELDGSIDLDEHVLPHLEGYRGSAPVRIGNAAHRQLQLDIYGELMDAVYLHDKYGAPMTYDLWRSLVPIVTWVGANWEQPDDSIWEVRSEKREFLYSRLLCWVALDRAIRLAGKRSLPAPVADWTKARDRIYRDVFEHFWDAERKSFVQAKGSRTLDASTLIMPLVRFLSPRDPRFLSTLTALEQRLVDDSLVFRYRPEDGFDDGFEAREGTFTMCSFWYVEALTRAGDLDKARFLFEKMLGYANHLGLYSEEIGPSGEHLGNFPQAFTHLALISAAFDLDRRLNAPP